jgi:putative oxidoreductase
MRKCASLKKYQDQFYFGFRVIIGLLFFLHGASKFGIIGDGNVAGFATAMSLPIWIAYLVAGVELLGGLGILTGFFTRLSAGGGAVVMVGAIVMAHVPKSIPGLIAKGGPEVALLYLAAFLILMQSGSRKWSLEKELLGKEIF